MKTYETLHLVKKEDLNHHGTLFAARAAAWFVEAAFATAACEKGDTKGLVCRNLHHMSFSRPIQEGSLVRLQSRVVYAGKTSLMVGVEFVDAMSGERAVEGLVSFVTTDEESGTKKEHGIVMDEPADDAERLWREQARKVRGEGKCTN